MKRVIISDTTLRDGNHAVDHKMTLEQIEKYCCEVDDVGVDIVEVGHGNGLGASSLLVGLGAEHDKDMLRIARKNLKKTKLGIHFIPGFGRIRDLTIAFDEGVDIFRIASHCTEVNVIERYINVVKNEGRIAYGVLMMSHSLNKNELIKNCKLIESYGADAVVIMDSAGYYLRENVKERITCLVDAIDIPVGFHGHNNLGMAIINSIEAIKSGATIIDASIKGFGAGAGNTQLEVLIQVLNRLNISNSVSIKKLFNLVKTSESFIKTYPNIQPGNIMSGNHGLFSGFCKHVEKQSKLLDVDEYDIYKALSERKVVAGQEDIIIEVANELSRGGLN